MKRKIRITIGETLLNVIDQVRGVISRSNYIEILVREAVHRSKHENHVKTY